MGYEHGQGRVYYSSFVGFMFYPFSVGTVKELPSPWHYLYLSLSLAAAFDTDCPRTAQE